MNALQRFGLHAQQAGETVRLPLEYQAPLTKQPYSLQVSMTRWHTFYNVKPGQLDELRGLIGQYRADWPDFDFRIVRFDGLFIAEVMTD